VIDHVGFPVSDYARSKAFYAEALAPLGYELLIEIDGVHTESRAPAVGFGRSGKPDFWIGGEGGLEKPLHIAIAAAERASVDAFHAAALAAGGRDNGAPGLRPQYHANYYAAFVLDPDGHNIEAVCHARAEVDKP
jgi:catechol 2,3-dioxygenase-like lactoylglutathione lyase family enzyme